MNARTVTKTIWDTLSDGRKICIRNGVLTLLDIAGDASKWTDESKQAFWLQFNHAMRLCSVHGCDTLPQLMFEHASMYTDNDEQFDQCTILLLAYHCSKEGISVLPG